MAYLQLLRLLLYVYRFPKKWCTAGSYEPAVHHFFGFTRPGHPILAEKSEFVNIVIN